LKLSSAPKAVKKTSNSIVLSWDKVNGAGGYIVKYSTESVAKSTDENATYDNETDQVTET
jgi:hypothetical protein